MGLDFGEVRLQASCLAFRNLHHGGDFATSFPECVDYLRLVEELIATTLADIKLFSQDMRAGAGNSNQFAKCLARIFNMLESSVSPTSIEAVVRKIQVMDVAPHELHGKG